MNNRWRQLVKLKSTLVIPEGIYCHGEGRWQLCPYWSMDEYLPVHEDGYCKYLGKSDWDINEETDREYGGLTIAYAKDKSLVGRKFSAHIGIGGLLWDMCKECGIKEED